MLIRKIVSLLLLGTVIVMLPSLRYIAVPYFYIIQCTTILLLSVSLFILIPNPYKPISILPLILYRRNFSVVWRTCSNVIKKGYIESVKQRKDNKELRDVVIETMRHTFNLKTDFSKMDHARPSIIIMNYCSDRIENLVSMLVPGNVSVMMRNTIGAVLGKIVKWTVKTEAKNSFEDTKNEVMKHTKAGRSVLTYATTHNTLSHEYIHRLRSGVFVIAKECHIPITLVAVDKVWSGLLGIIPYQNFSIVSSETFDVIDCKEAMHKSRVFFREKLEDFRQNKFTGIEDE